MNGRYGERLLQFFGGSSEEHVAQHREHVGNTERLLQLPDLMAVAIFFHQISRHKNNFGFGPAVRKRGDLLRGFTPVCSLAGGQVHVTKSDIKGAGANQLERLRGVGGASDIHAVGGQPFVDGSLEKLAEARALRSASGNTFVIEVDGGIKPHNAALAAAAGADVLVAGSAIFESGDYPGAIRALRRVSS